MAKIFYSTLVSKIRGRLAGGIFAQTRGVGYLKRHNASPTDKRSRQQTRIRCQISDLSGRWYTLSPSQKRLWRAYANKVSTAMSGINAYIAINNRLLYYLGQSAYRATPPPFPATPDSPRRAYVTKGSTMTFSVNCSTTTKEGLVIIAEYRPVFALERVTSQQWKFGASSSADALPISIVTDYPSTYTLKFRVRVMDLFGRASPWSPVLSRIQLVPGRYAVSPYGLSWFGV